MPKSIHLRRGTTWQSEVTTKFNELPMTMAYNIGSGGATVPDVVVFSEYIPNRNHYMQLRFDDDISKFGIMFPFAMTMECKATYADFYDIPKLQIDKCFDFLRYLSAVHRYVALVFKFQISKHKNRQFMILLEYDDIYPNTIYTFLRCYNNGRYDFYDVPEGKKNSHISQFLNQVVKTKRVKLLEINNLSIDKL